MNTIGQQHYFAHRLKSGVRVWVVLRIPPKGGRTSYLIKTSKKVPLRPREMRELVRWQEHIRCEISSLAGREFMMLELKREREMIK